MARWSLGQDCSKRGTVFKGDFKSTVGLCLSSSYHTKAADTVCRSIEMLRIEYDRDLSPPRAGPSFSFTPPPL